MPPLRKGARPAGGPVSGKEGSLRKRRRPHRGSPAVGKGDGEKTSSETCPSLRRRARGEMRRGKHPGRSGWYDVRAEGPGMPGMKRIRRKPCQCMKRIPRKPGRCRKACREENGLWDGRRKPGFQAMAWTYPPLFSHWLSGKGFLVSTESVLRPVRGGWVFRGLQGVHGGSGTFPVSVFFMALRSILRFAGVHGPVAGPPISPCFVLRFAKGDAARFERERGAGHSPAWATKLGPLPGGPFPRQRLLRVCFSGLLSGV